MAQLGHTLCSYQPSWCLFEVVYRLSVGHSAIPQPTDVIRGCLQLKGSVGLKNQTVPRCFQLQQGQEQMPGCY